jgi:hypothetical protein
MIIMKEEKGNKYETSQKEKTFSLTVFHNYIFAHRKTLSSLMSYAMLNSLTV